MRAISDALSEPEGKVRGTEGLLVAWPAFTFAFNF